MDAYRALVKDHKTRRLQDLLDMTDSVLATVQRAQGEPTAAPPQPLLPLELEARPPELTEPLRDYQLDGWRWLLDKYRRGASCILADEMGLGKTVQVIALLATVLETEAATAGPALIVAPLSTLRNWEAEIRRFAPQLALTVMHGSAEERLDLAGDFAAVEGGFRVALATYETVILVCDSPLTDVDWSLLVVDEAQRIKNHMSRLNRVLQRDYKSRVRVLLSGTPLQNNLNELWALLNFTHPQLFESSVAFDEWFSLPFGSGGGEPAEDAALSEEERLIIVNRLHAVLRPFMLRRTKADVLLQLPRVEEHLVRVPLSAWQQLLYTQVQRGALFATDEAGFVRRKRVANPVSDLRQVCDHPFLFASPGEAPPSELVRASGKFEALDRILAKLVATGHRVLVFFQMTQVMDLVEEVLSRRGLLFLRLDGSTKEDRQGLVNAFNAADSPYQVFILSTRAGGVGINLQGADTVILFDTDWNPQMDLQALARAHRIGQRRQVRVFRLCSLSPFEEHVLAVSTRKRHMEEAVIAEGKFFRPDSRALLDADNDASGSLREVLRKSLVKSEGAAASVATTDAEVNAIIATSPEEQKQLANVDQKLDDEARAAWLAGAGRGALPSQWARLTRESEIPYSVAAALKLGPALAELEMQEQQPTLGDGARPRRRARRD